MGPSGNRMTGPTKHGEASAVGEYLDQLPAEHAELVRGVFLDTSSVSLASTHEPTPFAMLLCVRSPHGRGTIGW